MNDYTLLNKAIDIAMKAHADQKDKYGAPYIGHITRVMNMGKTMDEKIVGVLHDIVEDTDWTFEKLEKQGFEVRHIEAIKCLTKTGEHEDYDKFIERIKQNPLAIKVKLNDLTDNMDIRRVDTVKEKDIARWNKYLKAYRELIEL